MPYPASACRRGFPSYDCSQFGFVGYFTLLEIVLEFLTGLTVLV